MQPCNTLCNDARPVYTTARGFCNDARQNCTETANFRHPEGNKIRRTAFVLVINFKWFKECFTLKIHLINQSFYGNARITLTEIIFVIHYGMSSIE